MVVEPVNKNKIRIRLSNTESVGTNIYKYTSLDKLKETKSKSSTCNYFLTTSHDLANTLIAILNDPSKHYYLDVSKTKNCIYNEMEVVENNKLVDDFNGKLSNFYTAFDYFKNNDNYELDLGNGIVRLDQGGKYNIYFNNTEEKVEMFRNSIISVLSDIIIEILDNKYLIYPVMKENIVVDNNPDKLIELAKKLENEYDEDIVKQIIIEGYRLLNK